MTDWRPSTICTHSGCFHCDEVTATAMLKYLYDTDKSTLSLIRTRDQQTLREFQEDPNTIVIDVGHVYDHEKRCYDHHQTSFNEPLEPLEPGTGKMIPLSSCGLIYRHYGHALIRKAATELYPDIQFTEAYLKDIYDDFYKYFVLSIDAGDNGIEHTEGWKLYHPVILPSTVANFNSDEPNNDEKQTVAFQEAVQYCSLTFRKHLDSTIRRKKDYCKGLTHFTDAMTNTPADIQVDGILILKHPIPVNQYLKEYDPSQHYKFIVVQSNEQWKLWTVNKKGKRFETLKSLISESKAKELVGEDQVVFIHKVGFTGATKSLEAALKIVRASAAMPDPGQSFMYPNVALFGSAILGLFLAIIYHIWF
jgi:uncharacterized UPF0160 family protein